MDTVSEHVVVVLHDDALFDDAQTVPPFIPDFALVAFDVENDSCAMELFDGRIGRGRVAVFEPVVGDGEKRAAQRVRVGDSGRRGMNFGLLGGPRLVRAIGRIRISRRESDCVGRAGPKYSPPEIR
jgi:hypothetical protein